MSVSDPLIKDIKGHTLKIFNEAQICNKITDSNKSLLEFCESLESIFCKGLIPRHNNFYNKKVGVDRWMFAMASGPVSADNFVYKNSVEEVRSCKSVCTSSGKVRLLVRHCLMKKCLHFPLVSLMKSKKIGEFYEKNSIIGDDILLEILLSVLLQCSKINFDFNLNNYYFLDSTWQLPDIAELELVPCRNLGISVSFSENKAVIVHIEANSVASEATDISMGDILAKLNGIEINSSCKGRLNSVLRSNKGRPISLVIIKAFCKKSEDIFTPMRHILSNLQISLDKIKSSSQQQIESNFSETSSTKNIKSGYLATYLGFVDVGNKGSVKQIEEAMKNRLSVSNGRTKEEVIFEIGEMNVKILNVERNDIILKHSYMQISSCGSMPNLPNYIAYIAGDGNCDTASKFICHIFYIESAEDAYTILQSIGQGFYRTHFAV